MSRGSSVEDNVVKKCKKKKSVVVLGVFPLHCDSTECYLLSLVIMKNHENEQTGFTRSSLLVELTGGIGWVLESYAISP